MFQADNKAIFLSIPLPYPVRLPLPSYPIDRGIDDGNHNLWPHSSIKLPGLPYEIVSVFPPVSLAISP